jgi:hypothetical protein
MDNAPVPARRYSDREITLILKGAAERQEEVAPREGGYSLAELEEIAAQAGIDAANVRAAARDLDRVDAPAGGGFVGSPTMLEFERMVEGEVPESEYGELVETIRRLTHTVGKPNRVERALEWSSSYNDIAHVHVTIAPVRGNTRIRIIARHDAGAFILLLTSLLMSPLLGLAVAGAMGLAGLPVLGAGLFGFGSVYLGDRALLRRISAGRTRKMTALVDALADEVARVAKPPAKELPPAR